LIRRYLECTAFVLLWMAAEHYFHLRPLTGQLLGIPVIAVFQIAVARRPLHQLWVRDVKSFRWDRSSWLISCGLALASGALLWSGRGQPAPGLNGPAKLFLQVLAGVVPAAFALRQQSGAAIRRALPAMIAAATFVIGWHAAWHDGVVLVPGAKLMGFFTTWLCEFVALFLVDEVVFRGALDPHLADASAGRLHEWCSAIFLSMLWAIWHLPAYNPGAPTFVALFAAIGPFSIRVVVLGVLLSSCARRARTLLPTSIVHAFANAHVLSLLR
jgi:hypothetical protein